MDKGLWKWITSASILATMCCLPSVVLVMFGLASVSTAAALSDTLYWGPFRWWLFAATALFLGYGLYRHFKADGICTIDDVKRERQKVVNTTLLAFTITIIGYLIFNYVILELIGIAVGLPWEEDAFWN
ncbi:MAG TPA: hypothetical protein QF621_06585 [Candidatus Thalassarchaeaceae archaeon]|nr:hypothetical protein [Candidatus Poseidoniaceae archaeon]HJL60000.1 hypothetical protein [Candidatus Thalassarchaeaceae archaeon]